jgi:hypothetical protein
MNLLRLGLFALVIFALLGARIAYSQESPHPPKDGNDLLAYCQELIDTADKKRAMPDGGPEMVLYAYRVSWCGGFVDGVVNANALYQDYLKNTKTKPYFCPPESGMTTGQSVRVVVKFLRDHPESLHVVPGALVLVALRTAFPCNR